VSGESATGLNGAAVLGDIINPIVYNTAGPSTFTFTRDVPAAPTTLTGSYNASLTPQPGVVLNWTAPPNQDVTSATVERAAVTNGVVGAYAAITGGGGQPANVTSPTFTDFTVNGDPGDTFAYEIVANSGDGASPVSNSVQVTVPTSAFTDLPSAPVSIGSVLLPAGNTGFATKGDTIETTFNQPLNTPAGNAQVTLADGSGDVATLVNGVDATFLVTGTSSNELVITLTGPPVFSIGSSLAYPVTYIGGAGTSGITGAPTSGGAGDLAWDLGTAGVGDGAGGAPMGVEEVPTSGVPVNVPVILPNITTTNASSTITGTGAISGATITLVVTTGAGNAAADGTFTTVASPTGTWGITDTNHALATGQTESVTQTILQGVGTSAALAHTT
jgi:hypothetical protein